MFGHPPTHDPKANHGCLYTHAVILLQPLSAMRLSMLPGLWPMLDLIPLIETFAVTFGDLVAHDEICCHASSSSSEVVFSRGINPSSQALICNARYLELMRHWAKLPSMNHNPGWPVLQYMLRNSS